MDKRKVSNFVTHEPCPKCGSRDNLGVWDDGHKWCFGCGYYEPPLNTLKQAITPVIETPSSGVYLPDDVEPYYPIKCLEWIKQYELSENDLRANNVVWSETKGLLIFPFFDSKATLLAWQGRNFGDVYRSKWFGRGNLEDVLTFKGTTSKHLILCEDIVSAIKIGKAGFYASPIFGSHISGSRLIRLKLMIDRLSIWLDSDKLKNAHKACKQAQLLGFDARTIYTKLDPKQYSTEEIKEILDRT